jgi:membrane protease YdiL (CAAX protease family)
VVALAYLIALTVAEALTTFISPRAGMVLHGLILIALLLQAALSFRQREYQFLVALALAPLIRLFSLALPLANFPLIFWYAVVGVPLFIATIMSMRVTGVKPNMIGVQFSWRSLPAQLLIGLSGLAIGYIEYLILRPDPLVAELSWELVWLPALILLLFTGFLEELIFRGIMQTSSNQMLGWLGVVFVALVFTVLHMGYNSILDMIFVFAVAIIFGLLVQRFHSLLGVSISHGLTNISLYLIFPFLLVAPSVPRSAPQNVLSAPADIFSPAVITPTFSMQTTPTPVHPVAATPTPSATPPTMTAAPTLPPSAIPTAIPTLPPTQGPIILPSPTPAPIIPAEAPTSEIPTPTTAPITPLETPSPERSTQTVTPMIPSETPTLISSSATPTGLPTLQPTDIPTPTQTSTDGARFLPMARP